MDICIRDFTIKNIRKDILSSGGYILFGLNELFNKNTIYNFPIAKNPISLPFDFHVKKKDVVDRKEYNFMYLSTSLLLETYLNDTCSSGESVRRASKHVISLYSDYIKKKSKKNVFTIKKEIRNYSGSLLFELFITIECWDITSNIILDPFKNESNLGVLKSSYERITCVFKENEEKALQSFRRDYQFRDQISKKIWSYGAYMFDCLFSKENVSFDSKLLIDSLIPNTNEEYWMKLLKIVMKINSFENCKDSSVDVSLGTIEAAWSKTDLNFKKSVLADILALPTATSKYMSDHCYDDNHETLTPDIWGEGRGSGDCEDKAIDICRNFKLFQETKFKNPILNELNEICSKYDAFCAECSANLAGVNEKEKKITAHIVAVLVPKHVVYDTSKYYQNTRIWKENCDSFCDFCCFYNEHVLSKKEITSSGFKNNFSDCIVLEGTGLVSSILKEPIDKKRYELNEELNYSTNLNFTTRKFHPEHFYLDFYSLFNSSIHLNLIDLGKSRLPTYGVSYMDLLSCKFGLALNLPMEKLNETYDKDCVLLSCLKFPQPSLILNVTGSGSVYVDETLANDYILNLKKKNVDDEVIEKLILEVLRFSEPNHDMNNKDVLAGYTFVYRESILPYIKYLQKSKIKVVHYEKLETPSEILYMIWI